MDMQNLNTLPFLAALLETVSITRAGEKLGLSQPAASRTMSRLRAQFNDPLLVRTRQGYALTDRARALATSVNIIMRQTEQIFAADRFDPQNDTRTFRIASTDYGVLAVIQSILNVLNQAAPHVSIDVVQWGESTLRDLERGTLDFAFFTGDLPADFHEKKLFSESYSLVMSKNHPLANLNDIQQQMALCAQYPRLIISYQSDGERHLDDVLARQGIADSPVRMTLPYFHGALAFLNDSQAVCVVPNRIALSAPTHLALHIVPLMLKEETFNYNLIWHHRSHLDAAHQWFRQFVATQVQTLKSNQI